MLEIENVHTNWLSDIDASVGIYALQIYEVPDTGFTNKTITGYADMDHY